MKKIEDNNSQVFTVDAKASEHQMKQATEKLPDFDLAKVNTWSGLLQRRSDRRLGVRLRGSSFCGSPGIRRSRAQTAVSPHSQSASRRADTSAI
ncbi:hypothetical protein Celaphus_00017553 [Cervus elaphus hippelaphus]|uniref:Uncharacterized protein n=1 Tax=Cervus elaphus hippelaphus TaxID=46360 RepID=A0A212C6V1_CEREH|nr:hypothetical protein Celaphus_00017553 [Cervus elaphus hippelaphus]